MTSDHWYIALIFLILFVLGAIILLILLYKTPDDLIRTGGSPISSTASGNILVSPAKTYDGIHRTGIELTSPSSDLVSLDKCEENNGYVSNNLCFCRKPFFGDMCQKQYHSPDYIRLSFAKMYPDIDGPVNELNDGGEYMSFVSNSFIGDSCTDICNSLGSDECIGVIYNGVEETCDVIPPGSYPLLDFHELNPQNFGGDGYTVLMKKPFDGSSINPGIIVYKGILSVKDWLISTEFYRDNTVQARRLFPGILYDLSFRPTDIQITEDGRAAIFANFPFEPTPDFIQDSIDNPIGPNRIYKDSTGKISIPNGWTIIYGYTFTIV